VGGCYDAAVRRLALTALLALPGCLELDAEIACGDGYVEPDVEECDPGVPESFEDACQMINPSRQGTCTVPACTIDYRACEVTCGNGMLDPAEECDPGEGDSNPGPSFGGAGPLCADLSPADGGSPYASGRVLRCDADCRWDRTPCSRCGDDRIQAGAEICDGDKDDIDAADAFCLGACVDVDQDDRPEAVRCNARCGDDCLGYVAAAGELGCCIPTGDPANSVIPCCDFEEAGVCVPGLGGE